LSDKFEGQWVTCDGRKDPHLYDPTVCLGEIRAAERGEPYRDPVLTELSREEGEKKFEQASNHDAVQDAAMGER